MSTAPAQQTQSTKVGFLLGLGILLIPLVFSWFTLQKGYSTFARVVSFAWLVVAMGLVANPRIEQAAQTAPSTAATQAAAATSALRPAADVVAAPKEAAAPVQPVSNWQYSASTDQMRGTKLRFASVSSDNELEFDFPYSGGSHGTLTLRDKAGDLNVLLTIEKGQFMCHTFSNNRIAVKFDDGPVQHFACSSPSDGTSNVTFLSSEKKFVKALQGSKKVIIEAEFFHEGLRQLTFQTSGLTWQ